MVDYFQDTLLAAVSRGVAIHKEWGDLIIRQAKILLFLRSAKRHYFMHFQHLL
jgi:hypothetical protein